MSYWIPEVWIAAGVGLLIGLIAGFIIVRATSGSIKRQLKTEYELKQVNNQLHEQQQEIEKHFEKTAELFDSLASDYQKMYQHFSETSQRLLSNPPPSSKTLFEAASAVTHVNEKNSEVPYLEEHAKFTSATSTQAPPKDYSDGSSGILTEKN